MEALSHSPGGTKNFREQNMIKTIPGTRWHENLRFLLAHFVPYYLSGIFIRCRFFSGLFSLLRIHPFHPGFFLSLQRKYASDRLFVKLLGERVLLLFRSGRHPGGAGTITGLFRRTRQQAAQHGSFSTRSADDFAGAGLPPPTAAHFHRKIGAHHGTV